MEYHALRNAVRKGTDLIFCKLTLILGIFMLIYGVFGEIRNIDNGEPFYILASYIPMIICGFLVVMDAHRSIYFATGMYAIGLGLSRVIANVFVTFLEENNYLFLISLLITIVGANMVYSGVRYLGGNTRTIALIIIGTVVLMIMSFIRLYLYTFGVTDPYEIFKEGASQIAIMALCLLYIALVCTENVRNGTSIAQFNRVFSGYGVAQGTISNASLKKDVCDDIVRFFGDSSEFVKEGDTGPVYAEYKFPCRDGPVDVYGNLQRWNGPEGEVYLSLSMFKGGSAFDVRPLRVEGMRISDGYLLIDCNDHQMKVFRIRAVSEDDGPIIRNEDAVEGVMT